MPHVAVTAIGSDRPGIVAAVTGVLVEQGCNLEDTSMTILRGHFAMMLVVDTPPELSATELESALEHPAAALELVVTVRPIDEAVASSPAGEAWTVSVYGADHPGIVHAVSSALADGAINITDLNTRLLGEDDARAAIAAAESETTLVADDVVRFGPERVIDALLAALYKPEDA